MLALFGTAIWKRNVIRARYWAWRLPRTQEINERGYYLACLSSAGSDALGAVEQLSRNPDPEVRLLAVFPLQKSGEQASLEILSQLLRDPVAEVREAAGLALAFSSASGAAARLCAATKEPVSDVAANAISACSRAIPPLTDCICAGLSHTQARVRAQSVESICELLVEQREKSDCQIESIVDRLSDNASFEDVLAIEAEAQRAGRFLNSRGLTASMPAREERTVAEVAAEKLSRIAKHTIIPVQNLTPDLKAQIAQEIRNQLKQRPSSQPIATTLPANTHPSASAPTQP